MSASIVEKELENCLVRENELFQTFGLQEEQLIQLVQQKKWTDVDAFLSRLKELGTEIEKVEEQRERAFTALCGKAGCTQGTPLGVVAEKLDPISAGQLCRLQKQLRETVGKVRSLSDGVLLYSKYMRNTIDEILKELFPHRKGKIYSPQGRAHAVREEPVVLDKHL